ncbi:MAG: hypothetical protein R3282_01865 [Rhodothermales bacterium]|nr:hypothetical protein [Rhodothermales bacterium]
MRILHRASALPVFVSVLLVVGCSKPPGSGSIDGFDLGLRAELHLKDLQRVPRPERAVIESTRSIFDAPPSGLDSIRVYSATAVVDEDEGSVPLEIWLMPLDESGGYLALAIDDGGAVRRSRIWGSSDVDADPEAAWENYWRQFEYEASRSVIPPERALPMAEVDSLWAMLHADTSAAASTTRMMYEHRLNMYENSFLLRRTMAMASGESVPPADWLANGREMYAQLVEVGERLRPIIGDSASIKYVAVAEEGGEILSLAVEDAEAAQGDRLRDRILTFRRRTCGACHGMKNHDAGAGGLKDAMMARLDDLGVRRDLFAVDKDVWGVPGDPVRSQSIADAVKAVLIMAGAD